MIPSQPRSIQNSVVTKYKNILKWQNKTKLCWNEQNLSSGYIIMSLHISQYLECLHCQMYATLMQFRMPNISSIECFKLPNSKTFIQCRIVQIAERQQHLCNLENAFKSQNICNIEWFKLPNSAIFI